MNILKFKDFLFESKTQEEYREFFSKLLKYYGVKSPAEFQNKQELSSKFYSDIKKGWINGEGLSKYGKDLIQKIDNGETLE